MIAALPKSGYGKATPVQTVEQTIRKDVGREDAGATGQIPTELQATVGLESPTTLPGEANAIGADVIETGQTMKLENQELRKEIVAVKKERFVENEVDNAGNGISRIEKRKTSVKAIVDNRHCYNC